MLADYFRQRPATGPSPVAPVKPQYPLMGIGQRMTTISAKPQASSRPQQSPYMPGMIVSPNGGVFMKTGNDMVNRLLASGLVNFGANLAGGVNSANSGPSDPMIQGLFGAGSPGSPGFTPAPFRDQAAPYVPPSLGGVPGAIPPVAAQPRYGFDDPITKAIRDAQAFRPNAPTTGVPYVNYLRR